MTELPVELATMRMACFSTEIDHWHEGGVWPSDHFGLLATFRLAGAAAVSQCDGNGSA